MSQSLSPVGLLVLIFAFSPLLYADSIEVISLQQRMAEDVIPLIQPMLGHDEVIIGQGSQLILRASSVTQAQVQRLLQELDRAPRVSPWRVACSCALKV